MLQQLGDERLAHVSAVVGELAYGGEYTHLNNGYMDWDLEGTFLCRVIDADLPWG